MAKSDNLLAILWLLRSRRRMTATEIAAEIEVDVRTVYRYIDALSVSGAPIVAETGPNGGYEILDSFRETPLFFRREERVALAHAAAFARKAGYPHSDALTSALAKMEHYMSPDQIESLRTHVAGLVVIDPDETADPVVYSDTTDRQRAIGSVQPTLQRIEAAVAGCRSLAFIHRKDGWHEPMDRTVDPYGLIYWRENWYVVGFCHLRAAMRMFRCDWMSSVTETGERFERPPEFSARRYFLESLIPASDRTSEPTVVLDGAPWAIEHFSHHWFVRHFIHSREAERISMSLRLERAIDTLPEIIVSFGSALTVISPAALATEVADFAQSVVTHYR